MKSEPDVYSIHHLEREGTNMWEGCRNYTVRNFFRDTFEVGDLAFFYHSNAKPSGIVGIMSIARTGYPDPTQFDPVSEYYDPKSPLDAPRWLAVDVQHVRTFAREIPLSELKAHPLLQTMSVCDRGQRLSVMPVTPEQWEAVLSLPGLGT